MDWQCAKILFNQEIRKAGESEIRVMTKSSTVDLVTKTDERVEKIIIGSLKEEFGEGTHWWAMHTHHPLFIYISVVVCGYSSLIHCCFVLQFHWGGVSCQRRAMYLDWQTYMDHRPSGQHHKLCTWVSFLSDVRKDAYNFLGSNNFW